MHRILLGFDATPAAWDALDRAATLAAATGAEVLVAHVVPFDPGEVGGSEPLRLARSALAERHVPTDTRLAVGDAGEQLESIAHEADVDVVVVGSPPAGPLERLLGGSVALHLVCHAPATVVVARRP